MIATELLRGKLDQHRDREYAWLQLDNGLEALLISNGNKANPSQGNESLYNAAAAMAVQVGSFADPPELGIVAVIFVTVVLTNKSYFCFC